MRVPSAKGEQVGAGLGLVPLPGAGSTGGKPETAEGDRAGPRGVSSPQSRRLHWLGHQGWVLTWEEGKNRQF